GKAEVIENVLKTGVAAVKYAFPKDVASIVTVPVPVIVIIPFCKVTGPLTKWKAISSEELSLATNENGASVNNLFPTCGKSIPSGYKVTFKKLLSTVTGNFANCPLLLIIRVSVPGLTAVIIPSGDT